jgi:hypothetical protein
MLDDGAVAATDCLMKRNPVKGYCSDTQAEMVDCGGELVFTDAPQRLLFFGNLLNACPGKQITSSIMWHAFGSSIHLFSVHMTQDLKYLY